MGREAVKTREGAVCSGMECRWRRRARWAGTAVCAALATSSVTSLWVGAAIETRDGGIACMLQGAALLAFNGVYPDAPSSGLSVYRLRDRFAYWLPRYHPAGRTWSM